MAIAVPGPGSVALVPVPVPGSAALLPPGLPVPLLPGKGRRGGALSLRLPGCRLFPDAVVDVPVLDHGICPIARHDDMVKDQDSDAVEEALKLAR